MTRTQAREQAFILIFEKEFNADATADDLINAASESELFETDKFAKELTEAAIENFREIDAAISENLKGGWKISRISKVSLALLRLAVCEIRYFDDIPVSVSINEAVDLAKKYGSNEDQPFVNGVLGSVSRKDGVNG